MANISLKSLYAQKEREFRNQGASLTRFTEDFIDAVNMAISAINIGADLDTEIALATSINDTVALDQRYLFPFSQLVSLCLFDGGCRLQSKEAVARIESIRDSRDDLIDSIRQGILTALQDADTDDDTYSNVGLGALG
jgi:hypothetical protein